MTPEINSFPVEQHFGPLDNCHPLRTAEYPGVYFLCCGTSIVYVGKTKNIAKRIARHVGKDFDTVMVMRVPEELLTAIEMHWIQRLRPPLNRNSGQGRPELGKITITVRLRPKTKVILDRTVTAINASAAADSLKMDKSTYIENLLLAKFKRDGLE